MRSGRQITLTTPKRLSRFGIEVDEALRVGGSGFLGESDAGEAGLQTESESFRGKFFF
jgi:hypothetical protein